MNVNSRKKKKKIEKGEEKIWKRNSSGVLLRLHFPVYLVTTCLETNCGRL